MQLPEILKYPDERLRQISKPVEQVDDSIRELMNVMLKAMYEDDGVGLAAIQIGIPKRILVLDLQTNDDQEREDNFYPLFVANPVILEKSTETVAAREGCLSLPEQSIEINRPCKITLEYIDFSNNKKTLIADGWLARALQHEMDHLDGKLLIDYLSKIKKDLAVNKLKKIKKSHSSP